MNYCQDYYAADKTRCNLFRKPWSQNVKMLNIIKIIVSKMTSRCVGTVQMRKEPESWIRKWEEMWFKTTAEDREREGGGQPWRAMEDCSIDERLQQETFCHRQWTDEYVECPAKLMRQNVVVVWLQRLLVNVVRHTGTSAPDHADIKQACYDCDYDGTPYD